MMESIMMYAVTGATGHLGQLIVEALGKKTPASQIVALARDPAKASELHGSAGSVRAFDYDKPETLRSALEGVTKLVLISSNAMGRRTAQHKADIDAANGSGLGTVLLCHRAGCSVRRQPRLEQTHRPSHSTL